MSIHKKKVLILYMAALLFSLDAVSQKISTKKIIAAGYGWAGNSINTVIFRKNSF